MEEEGPLFGNFKLVLQSVVCHRGVTVDSGHYISLVRANSSNSKGSSHSDDSADDTWLRFDDLANPRVMEVDIKKALREESPYLLFYQVQPIDEELASRGDPPTYDEARINIPSADPSRETLTTTATDTDTGGEWDKVTRADVHPESIGSDDIAGRNSMSSNRRSSVAFEDLDGSLHNISRGRTQPPTPEDQKTGFLSASRRGSRIWLSGGNRSRPNSPSGETRLSITLSRLTGRGSKDKLVSSEAAVTEDPVIVINEVPSAENGQQAQSPVKEKKESGISRSKSKKEKKDRLRSKSRDPNDALVKGKAKDKEKNRPDRECVVM